MRRVGINTKVLGWCRIVSTAILLLSLSWNKCVSAQEPPQSTVGIPGRIQDLILPGPELVAQPIDDRTLPVLLRILQTTPHGDSWRYDIQYVGMEPGDYDLTEFLVTKDGSAKSALPPVPITIRSLLPPGQVEPNTLMEGSLPFLGGYRRAAIGVAAMWGIVLALLVFAGHRRKIAATQQASRESFASLLGRRLELAASGKLPRDQFAELERMVLEYWRQRLGWQDLPHEQVVTRLRDHEQAGPLFRQLEQWMHSPRRDDDVDLATLLKPIRDGASRGESGKAVL